MKLPINIEKLLGGRAVEGDRIEYKTGWNPDAIYRSVQDAGTGSCTELGCGTSHAAEPNAYNSTETENVIRIYGRKKYRQRTV